jgi:hypothetical protein
LGREEGEMQEVRSGGVKKKGTSHCYFLVCWIYAKGELSPQKYLTPAHNKVAIGKEVRAWIEIVEKEKEEKGDREVKA